MLGSIILDEVLGEVILTLRTEKDLNLSEHGIVIYRKGRKWKFEYADYIYNRYQDLFDAQ